MESKGSEARPKPAAATHSRKRWKHAGVFRRTFFAFKHFILVKSNNLFAQLSISHAVQVASKLIQKAKSTSKELRGSPRERGERLEGFSRRKNNDVLHVHAEK